LIWGLYQMKFFSLMEKEHKLLKRVSSEIL